MEELPTGDLRQPQAAVAQLATTEITSNVLIQRAPSAIGASRRGLTCCDWAKRLASTRCMVWLAQKDIDTERMSPTGPFSDEERSRPRCRPTSPQAAEDRPQRRAHTRGKVPT